MKLTIAAIKLSDLKKANQKYDSSKDDKPSKTWLKMSDQEKENLANKEKQRRLENERKIGEKIEPYKAERLWEKEKKGSANKKSKAPDNTKNEDNEKAPDNEKNEDNEKAPDNEKTSDNEKEPDNTKKEDVDVKTEEQKEQEQKEPDNIYSEEKVKKDAAKITEEVKEEIKKLPREKRKKMAEDIVANRSTYVKDGKIFLTDTYRKIGESTFAKLALFSAAFIILGPFAAVLGREALEITDDVLEERKRKHLEKLEREREEQIEKQRKYIESITPKSLSIEDKDTFRSDYGNLSKKELWSKYKKAGLNKNDLIGYLTYEEQLEKLKSAKADKDGIYHIKLSKNMQFTGNEDQLRQYIEMLELKRDSTGQPDTYYQDDTNSKSKKKKINSKRKSNNKKKVVSADDNKNELAENSDIEEVTEDEVNSKKESNDPIEELKNVTAKKKEIEDKDIEGIPDVLKKKLKQAFEDAPDKLDVKYIDTEDEDEYEDIDDENGEKTEVREPKSTTKYGEEIEDTEPIDDEEEESKDDKIIEDKISEVVNFYLKRDPVKLKEFFEKKYPSLVNKKKQEKTEAADYINSLEEVDI
jgi:hypothetical protein